MAHTGTISRRFSVILFGLSQLSIFLIDHAWTYEAEFARIQLRTIPGLARRMAFLMDLIKDSTEHVGNGEEERHNDEEKQQVADESAAKISLAEGFFTDEDGTVH